MHFGVFLPSRHVVIHKPSQTKYNPCLSTAQPQIPTQTRALAHRFVQSALTPVFHRMKSAWLILSVCSMTQHPSPGTTRWNFLHAATVPGMVGAGAGGLGGVGGGGGGGGGGTGGADDVGACTQT